MDNRAGEMVVFVAAAEKKSFSAAGRSLRLSPSAVSKLVTRIEDRLGTRLLVRSTRTLELTPEGEVYLERARRILADIDEAERIVADGARAVPRGALRINASVGFGELEGRQNVQAEQAAPHFTDRSCRHAPRAGQAARPVAGWRMGFTPIGH